MTDNPEAFEKHEEPDNLAESLANGDDLLRHETSSGQPVDESTSSSSDSPQDEIAEVRVGSPFAVDPNVAAAKRPIEPFYDVGPIRYTAMGAVAASTMVLAFAGISAWWFPSGGALVAALGCVLSIFGMYSVFRKTSVSLLALHLFLFVVSYGRSIG